MAATVPLEHVLALAFAMFVVGLVGVLVRRNFLFMLMSTEIMFNAAALAFIGAGEHWASADGQVMYILLLTLAGAEVCVGLALILQLSRHRRSLDVDSASDMHG